MRRRTAELLVILLAVSAVCSAGSREVRIALHLKPELPIDGTENFYVGPIMIEPREGENVQSVDLTAAREFEIYLRKILRRDARLQLIPKPVEIKPPSTHLAALLIDGEFWKAIGEETGAPARVVVEVKTVRAGEAQREDRQPGVVEAAVGDDRPAGVRPHDRARAAAAEPQAHGVDVAGDDAQADGHLTAVGQRRRLAVE